MTIWIDMILQGVLLGGLYALFATGLSLSFGVMRLVNIAHGDFIVLAAYVGIVAVDAGLPLIAAPFLAVPLMAALGYVLQRGILNRTLGRGILPPLLVTFGLSVIIQNVLLTAFSADSRGLNAGAIEIASLEIGGGVALGWFPLLVLATAVAVVLGLQILFRHTDMGRAFRAASDDPDTVQLMGVDNRRIYATAMAVAMAVVAVAGFYLAVRTTVAPTIGPSRLLFAFEAVIMGGMGSLWGTLAGGIILGISQSVGHHFDPGWGVLAGHLVFLSVLMARPNGMFPRTLDV